MTNRQDSDDLAWDRSDEIWEEATKQVRSSSACRKVVEFAEKVFANSATLIPPLIIGGFNVLYPIRIEALSLDILIRLPCPNQAVFPEEKTLAEAATAAFISTHTRVPIPRLFKHGIDPEIGPFIIIQDLRSRRVMVEALEAPRHDPSDTPVLQPNISEQELRSQYLKIALCVIRLAQPVFPRIGSLVEDARPTSYHVSGRPITLNMTNMVQLSNIPASIFPAKGTTYGNADEWYTVLADMHIATLIFQHNDMVISEDDCRTKYIARQLFRRLAKQGRLSTFGFSKDNWSAYCKQSPASLPLPDNSGSFRLWSDDFRPANILIDGDDQVLGAIDWEFAYIGPTRFVLDPPWWLLLEVPEMWDGGIDDWATIYEKRLQTWLSAMTEAEEHMNAPLKLAAHMRESWITGRFWLNYAARKSWAFDAIYWKYLDEKFFGERDKDIPTEQLWKIRVALLNQEERSGMERLVQTKMEELKERVLIEWDAVEARNRLSEFLFD